MKRDLVALGSAFFVNTTISAIISMILFDVGFSDALYKTLYIAITFSHPHEIFILSNWAQRIWVCYLMMHFLGLFAMLVSIIFEKKEALREKIARRCSATLSNIRKSVATQLKAINSKSENDNHLQVNLNQMIRESQSLVDDLIAYKESLSSPIGTPDSSPASIIPKGNRNPKIIPL